MHSSHSCHHLLRRAALNSLSPHNPIHQYYYPFSSSCSSSSSSSSQMARAISRAIPISPRPISPKSLLSSLPVTTRFRGSSDNAHSSLRCYSSSFFGLKGVEELGVSGEGNGSCSSGFGGIRSWVGVFCDAGDGGGGNWQQKRSYRKVRRRAVKSGGGREKQLDLSAKVLIEEGLPNDPEVANIAEMLQLNAPMAVKLALDGLKDSKYKTRDTAINDVAGYATVELSLLLCNDEFIRKLNKEWRDEDHATDVLSLSQHIPDLKLPVLMLGDIVISVETAARQAEERGHSLLDEIRILLVHGLLHLMGFDHELSEEAQAEMEKEEEVLLKCLGWKGKGLIRNACEAQNDGDLHVEHSIDRKKEGSLRFYKPKFKCIFCDMDGTLLNHKSQITPTTANALKEAASRGVKIIIATGKARPAAINALDAVNLAGKDGIVSEFSPGVFVQGLLVYGTQGREIFRRNLDTNVCREAFLYSQEHGIPLVAFCEDRLLTLFGHPYVDRVHTVYQEPEAEIMTSVEELLATAEIQKLLFLDTAEAVSSRLRPYWEEAIRDRAKVVQAVSEMLEIVPIGTSKGSGVRILLDHLGVRPNEIMAIGDGENDVEMLELASLGVALSNGSEKAKAVANVIGLSNDEDGAADAIYRYAF